MQPLTLDQRVELLHSAVLQARSCGDTVLVDRLETKGRVLDLQRRIADSLQEGAAAALPAPTAAEDLRAEPKPLEELYNDYAVPHQVRG